MLVAIRGYLRTRHFYENRRGHGSHREAAVQHGDPSLPQQSDQPPPLHRPEGRRERGAEEPDSLQEHANAKTVNTNQANTSLVDRERENLTTYTKSHLISLCFDVNNYYKINVFYY